MKKNILFKSLLIALTALLLSACDGIEEDVTITVDGVERLYKLDTPDDTLSREEEPALLSSIKQPDYPVVFSFHGAWPSGGSGDPAGLEGANSQKLFSQFELLGNDEKFIVVYPQANYQRNSNNTLLHWRGLPSDSEEDLEFFDAMLDKLKNDTHFNIDEDRVYVTGFSSGAAMAARLACKRSDVIAGIGMVDHSFTGQLDDCDTSAIVENSLDIINFSRANPRFGTILEDLAATTDLSCSAYEETYSDNISSCIEFPDCEGEVKIKECFRNNQTHLWPGGPGLDNENIKATDEIWSFFNE